MSIIKSVLVATALVVAATAANAASREELNSGYHGNTASSPYRAAVPGFAISGDARGSFAQAGAVRQPAASNANSVLDRLHSLRTR